MISSKHQQRTAQKNVRLRTRTVFSRRHKRWSPDDSKGLLIAMGILCGWTWSLSLLLTTPLSDMRWWTIPLAMLLQTFLFTGLFITAHDALHGSITPNRRSVNHAIGLVAGSLYSLFDLRRLTWKHWEHHLHPGDPVNDPDYHNGFRDRFDHWYARFMMNYVSLRQLIGMAIVYNLLLHLAGLPAGNLLLFWVGPALLSTFQLFLFGTYLPHREEPHGHINPHQSRSVNYPVWLSFLACYHFGYHLEHHSYPRIPWWKLPAVRHGRIDPGPAFIVSPEPSSPSLS